MKRIGLVVPAFVLACAVGVAHAWGPAGKRITERLTVFTTNTSVTIKNKSQVEIQVVEGTPGGTPTVSFACKLHGSAAIQISLASFGYADCTTDCLRPTDQTIAPDCDELIVTMSTCTGCSYPVFISYLENRAQ